MVGPWWAAWLQKAYRLMEKAIETVMTMLVDLDHECGTSAEAESTLSRALVRPGCLSMNLLTFWRLLSVQRNGSQQLENLGILASSRDLSILIIVEEFFLWESGHV